MGGSGMNYKIGIDMGTIMCKRGNYWEAAV